MSAAGPGEARVGTLGRMPFTLREQLLLAMLGSSTILAKFAVRMPLHIPGRSGVFWIPFFVIGRGLVHKRGAGLAMGLIAGFLALIATPSNEGLFVWVKYAAAGVTMDVMAALFNERLDVPVFGAIAGAFAHLAKSASVMVVSVLMGIPATSLAVGLGVTATTHVVFGALGGLIGSLVLIQIRKVGVFGTDKPNVAAEEVAES